IKEKFTKRLNELESKYIEVTTRTDMLNDESASLKNRYEEIRLILSKVNEELSETERVLSQLEMEKQSIYTQYSEQEKEILKKKQEYEEIEKTLGKINNEISRLTENNQDIRRRVEMIQSQRNQKEDRRIELESEINDLEKHLLEIVEKENELVKELDTIKSTLEEYNRQKNARNSQLEELVRREKEIRAEIDVIRRQINDYQGFGHAVRKIFENKDTFKGLIDVVANLIDFDKSLSTAYEILLGGAVQHVVVSSAEDGKQIIEFLKNGEYGRATFIPLDLIDATFSPISGVENEAGFVGYAAKLITVPKEYNLLPAYLFGSDIIVDNMDHAIQLKRKYNIRSRIVTIDGELISGKGAMSGGRSKEDYSNSLIARRVRLKTLETELKDVEENKGVIENEINNISEEIKQLQGNMDLVREELANISGRSLSSKRVLEELQKSLKEVTNELSDLIKLEAEYTGKYEGNLARIETLDNQSKEYEEKRKVLQVDVSEFSKQLDKHRKKLEELNESIATYRAELKS
ncbi:MAG TPA: chromosome segregation protein SMC, partial [Fervidobacterium sp.]|nr:chromosome segregation protein SMC [Fervidobacterium sp.]